MATYNFLGFFGILYVLALVAGLVLLFWLGITAIRALNLYIKKTRIEVEQLSTGSPRHPDTPQPPSPGLE